MPDAFPRKSRRFIRNLGGMPLGLLASLVGLTAAAWALTLYQTFSMDMPMGIAVRGGMEGMEGMAGMAMAGIAADGWSVAGAAAFLAQKEMRHDRCGVIEHLPNWPSKTHSVSGVSCQNRRTPQYVRPKITTHLPSNPRYYSTSSTLTQTVSLSCCRQSSRRDRRRRQIRN